MKLRFVGPMLALVLGMAGLAQAKDMYGALAFNTDDGSYGWAVDAATQEDANAAALDECGDGCEVVMTFRNTCASFAMGDKGAWGWAHAPTKEDAQRASVGYCSEKGRNCKVKVWACTTR